MKVWYWKRWVWTVVVGTTAAVGLTVAQQGNPDATPPGPPKVGDVISLKFKDGPERQVKVIKSEKQADGSYLSEVKDSKTGETFTLADGPPTTVKDTGKPGDPPKAKPRTSDPMMPAFKDTMSDGKDKDKKPLGGLLTKSPSPASAAMSPTTATPPEPEKRRLIDRLLGRNKPATPTPPTTPVSAATPGPAMSAKPTPSSTVMPPAVKPTPGSNTGSTAEPPRVMPSKSIVPPTPVIPTPVGPPPGTTGNTSVPGPLPAIPSVPSVGLPSVGVPGGGLPALPALPSLPAIPTVPGGTSMAEPMHMPMVVPAAQMERAPVAPVVPVVPVTPVVHANPASAALAREIEPYTSALQNGTTPTERSLAARALAGGRHGTTDTVKTLLFRAAVNDPNSAVRSCCIGELCKLGYYEPAFIAYLQKSSTDSSNDVRAAAKDALAKMTPSK